MVTGTRFSMLSTFLGSLILPTLILGLILGTLSACHPSDATGGRQDGVMLRDSAGIKIVENTGPAWAEGGGWRLSVEPVLSLGEINGPEEFNFYRAVSALRLDDGRIVIANGGTNELRFFSPDGEFLHATGGEGEGPGEFRGIASIHRLGTDSLAVLDFRLFRFSILDLEGTFGRNLRVAEGTTELPFPHGFFEDGTLLAAIHGTDSGDYSELGVLQNPVEYHRYDRGGRHLTALAALPGEKFYRGVHSDGSAFTFTPGHAVRPWAAVGRASWVWGPGDAFEIQEWSPEGHLLGIFRLQREPRPMPEAVIQEWEERLKEMRPEAAAMRRAIPLPDFLPTHEEIVVDRMGNVWMAGYEVLGEEPPWTIFDPAGRWLGELKVPSGGRLTDIGGDYVLGVWRDELDVETIRVYALHKPEG